MIAEGFWVHNKTMDLCIEVLEVNGLKLKVRWWNLGYVGDPWPIDGTEYIEILPDGLKNWSQLTHEQMVTPRGIR